MGRYRKEEKIEKANRLMILFDNIRKMDDTEIVVFLHNLAHYLYNRTKGELYLIEGKEIKRLENLQERIDSAIKYIENNINELKEEHLFIEFTKEELYMLLDILKGSDKE